MTRARVRKRSSRAWSVVAVLAFVPLLWGSTAAADDYGPFTAPTGVGQIEHEVVRGPGPAGRTNVGIYEQVSLSIDTANWEDVDCNTTKHELVYDTIGDITWDAGWGTCSPNTGSSTTYTAPGLSCTDQVELEVDDSPLGDDDPVERNISFSVYAPSGMTVAIESDSPWGTPGPPNNYVGPDSIFRCTITPTAVCFRR